MHTHEPRDGTGSRPRATGLVIVSLVASALTSGCAGSRHDAVDPGRARDALKTALDGWKKGDTPDALKVGSPPIVVQDLDWIAGETLVDYQLDGDGKEVEANLYVPVKLTIRSKQGKEIKKSVSYVVATSPRLMVFRNLR